MVSLKGLANAFPGKPDVQVSDNGDAKRVVVTWPEGTWAKLDVHSDRVYWYSLNGPKSAKRMKKVHSGTSEFFAKQGVHRFECAARDEKSKELLLKCGDWREFEAEGETYLAWEF